jgi:rSAM/selenodomain-associated transferase 2
MLVSVIIPTLNEAATIEQCCTTIAAFPDVECVIADGGSNDGTQQVLERICGQLSNVHWLQAERGRARQMNAGANISSGDWFIFLHADTILSEASYHHFRDSIVSPQPPALHSTLTSGAFTFRVTHEHWRYRYLEWYVAQRCRFLKLPFGDQALFARKDIFKKLGGYREDFPLMEDVDFVRRANVDEGFRVIEAPVFTSARRYEKEGYWKRAIGNVYLQLLYRCGVHPRRLAALYYK